MNPKMMDVNFLSFYFFLIFKYHIIFIAVIFLILEIKKNTKIKLKALILKTEDFFIKD